MSRTSLFEKIKAYNPEFEREKEFRVLFLKFLSQYKNCFKRTLSIGHITGSAWIINKEKTACLLTHHKKLDKWLQLGGHADGDTDIIKVSSIEAYEESGLKSIDLISEDIFDLDIHTIPARKSEPEHLHYDVRFLFQADDTEKLIISNESKDLSWVNFKKLQTICEGNESILRMAEKTARLFKIQFKVSLSPNNKKGETKWCENKKGALSPKPPFSTLKTLSNHESDPSINFQFKGILLSFIIKMRIIENIMCVMLM